MTGSEREVPDAWDRIREPAPDLDVESVDAAPHPAPLGPSRVSLIGIAWGDLLGILGVCTSACVALAVLGYGTSWTTLPWAAALGLVWWTTATAVLLLIRQGTPGMLLSGFVFEDTVPRSRVVWVVLGALAMCVTLGLPGLLGADASPLRLAAGTDVVSAVGLDVVPR